MSTRYCLYCQREKPAEGFKNVRHVNTGTLRGQCVDCQETRRKSRAELIALAEVERKERNKR